MTTKPMPTWLEAKLIADGVMTTDRVTKHAKPRRCPGCHLFVLVGLDDTLPSRTTVDTQPVSALGELQALLAGRNTYGIDSGELFIRYASRITHKSADLTPVHVQHLCNGPPLPVNPLFIRAPPNNQEDPPY